MADAQISFGPKLGLLNNAAIGEIYYDQLRPFLRGMDALVQLTAISYLSSPPSDPSDGDTYIVVSGSGEWAESTNQIAVYSAQITQMGNNTLNPGWDYYVPEAGWVGFVGGGTGFVYFNGTDWVDLIPTATADSLGLVQPDNSTITISDGVISAVGGSSGITQLTGDVTAGPGTGSVAASVVKVNGAAVPISSAFVGTNGSGQIVSASLPVATGSSLGVVEPDGTTITISDGGVISASGGTANYTQLPVSLPSPDGSTSYALGFTPASPAASFYFVNGLKRVYGTYYQIVDSNLQILAATPPNTANGDSGHELYAS